MEENLTTLYDRIENQDPRLTDPIAVAMVERVLAKQRAAALLGDAQARAPKGASIGGQWVGNNGGSSGGKGSFDVAPELINGVGSGLKARAEAVGLDSEASQGDIDQVNRYMGIRQDILVATSQASLEPILEEGIKTAKETGLTTRTSYSIDQRNDWEKELFGHGIGNPIYGFMGGENISTKVTIEDIQSLGYGDVVLTLKSSVKDRTTATFGDSLDLNSGYARRDHGFPDEVLATIRKPSVPFPINDRARANKAFANSEWSTDRRGKPRVEMAYVEAQIWGGGVSVSEISSVEFRKKSPSKEVIAKLSSLGIPWKMKDKKEFDSLQGFSMLSHADASPRRIAKHPDGAVLLEAGENEFGFKMAVAVSEGERSKPMVVEAFLKFGGWELTE